MSLELCLEHSKRFINVDYNYYETEFIFLWVAQIVHLIPRGFGVIGVFLSISYYKVQGLKLLSSLRHGGELREGGVVSNGSLFLKVYFPARSFCGCDCACHYPEDMCVGGGSSTPP